MPCSAGEFPHLRLKLETLRVRNLHGLLATYRNHLRRLGPPVHFNRRCAYQADRETVFRLGWRFHETEGRCLGLREVSAHNALGRMRMFREISRRAAGLKKGPRPYVSKSLFCLSF
jgi:hypothetical protein